MASIALASRKFCSVAQAAGTWARGKVEVVTFATGGPVLRGRCRKHPASQQYPTDKDPLHASSCETQIGSCEHLTYGMTSIPEEGRFANQERSPKINPHHHKFKQIAAIT